MNDNIKKCASHTTMGRYSACRLNGHIINIESTNQCNDKIQKINDIRNCSFYGINLNRT